MLLYELVEAEQSIRFTFGRFNPPHIGHKKLIDAVAKGSNGNYYIFPTHTHDGTKNPLRPKEKVGFMRSMFPQHAKRIVYNQQATNIIRVMKTLQAFKYNKVTMVVGDDRVAGFQQLLNQYNGKEYNFNSINVESAGVRDPDAEGVEGASATKVREAAAENDFKTFKSMIPGSTNLAKAIFQAIRQNLNTITEAQPNKPTVYIDMDGVLADFFTEYAKMAGIKSGDYRQIPRAAIDPTLNKMVGTDFFNRLPKIPTADQLLQIAVNFSGGDYNILSSPLRGDKANSSKWKKVWIARELSIKPKQVIITGRKESYATGNNGIPNILIDDRGANIERWRAAGGFGIKYQADEDSLDVVVKGLKQYAKATA